MRVAMFRWIGLWLVDIVDRGGKMILHPHEGRIRHHGKSPHALADFGVLSRTTKQSISDEGVPKRTVGSIASAAVRFSSSVSKATGKQRHRKRQGRVCACEHLIPLPLKSRSRLLRNWSTTDSAIAGASIEGSLPEDTSILVGVLVTPLCVRWPR
ncbi:hypothetical protein MRX96_051007 [Rhipicephalus microplus]